MNKKFYLSLNAPPPYVGPGDIVASAIMWSGLRGYNTAYCTGSNPAMDVVDAATGLIQTTINITTAGALDVATISGLGYAVKVKKLYDQTGNGNHLSQSTLSKMPSITLSGLGALPILVFASASSQCLLTSGAVALVAPFTLSTVDYSASAAANAIIFQVAVSVNSYYANTSNQRSILGTLGLTKTSVNDNAWHAAQLVFNGASSSLAIDGSTTSGTAGTTTPGTNVVAMGSTGAGTGQFWNGRINEMGVWSNTNFSSGDKSSMNSNQHTYWGF